MTTVGDVSFELERFEWTADDRLEVVGRWNGVSGRRMFRPALTLEVSGGRKHRVTGSAETDGDPEAPWRASFAWEAARANCQQRMQRVEGTRSVLALDRSPRDPQ